VKVKCIPSPEGVEDEEEQKLTVTDMLTALWERGIIIARDSSK